MLDYIRGDMHSQITHYRPHSKRFSDRANGLWSTRPNARIGEQLNANFVPERRR